MSEGVFAKYLNGLEREPWGGDEADPGDPVGEEQLIEWEAGRGHIPFWIHAAYQAVYETGAREEMEQIGEREKRAVSLLGLGLPLELVSRRVGVRLGTLRRWTYLAWWPLAVRAYGHSLIGGGNVVLEAERAVSRAVMREQRDGGALPVSRWVLERKTKVFRPPSRQTEEHDEDPFVVGGLPPGLARDNEDRPWDMLGADEDPQELFESFEGAAAEPGGDVELEEAEPDAADPDPDPDRVLGKRLRKSSS